MLLLLGLPADARVLVIGPALRDWQDSFHASHFRATMSVVSDLRGEYELILYHSGCAASRKELIRQLERVRDFLTEGGASIVFCRNFFSLATLKKVKQRKIADLRNQLYSGHAGFLRAVDKAGLTCRHEFMAFPSLENVEEFVEHDSRLLELPHYWHILYHTAQRLGVYQFVADSFVLLSVPYAIEDGPLTLSVASLIASAEKLAEVHIHLERFDLRLRGAMVLFLTEERTGQSYIARVVSESQAQKIVGRNQEFLKELQSNPGLSSQIRTLIPRPIGQLSFHDSTVFLETQLKGVLAWKVNSGGLRERIHKEAVQFIFQLQFATRSQIFLNDSELGRLFDEDLRRVSMYKEKMPFLHEGIAEAVEKIKNFLGGRKIFLSISHGDYGYGNILVDSHTGKITGVIDWDTGRKNDLPGIDLLNLMVQTIMTEKSCGLLPAFIEVSSMVASSGSLDEAGLWERKLNITHDLLPAILHTAFLRYISRSAQYPELFISKFEDYCMVFNYLRKKVTL